MVRVSYSVVVPVYNGEKSLDELHKRLIKVFGAIKKTFEIILVDDCSKDNSWEVMQKLHKKDKRVKIIQLMRNFGQHNALMAGFNYAKGEYIITIDDDLQHPPEEITKLIKKSKEGYDVVYGQFPRRKYRWYRNISSRFINKILSSIIGINYNITQFKLIKKQVIDEIIKSKNYNIMTDVLISNIVTDRKIGHCLVKHNPRKFGESNYSFTRLISYALNMIFSYTLWPLKLATMFGFLFSFISALLAIFFLVYYFVYGISVSGWTTLILSITFFSGLILFVLGVTGEYIGRVFLNIIGKPQFVIKEIKM